MAAERSHRAPIGLLIAGVAMTVLGWAAFTVALFVVVGEGEEGSTDLQNVGALVAVLGAVVGSIGPILVTAGAIWWAFSARARQPGQRLSSSSVRVEP